MMDPCVHGCFQSLTEESVVVRTLIEIVTENADATSTGGQSEGTRGGALSG